MIIRLEFQILCAVLLDLIIGDPRKIPHPVQGIGRAAGKLESITRRFIGSGRKAGVLTWFLVIGTTGSVTALLLKTAYFLHPLAGDLISILILYTAFAAKDLIKHASGVYKALEEKDIEKARYRVGMIVSRETANLDKTGIIRSAIESVAENLSDGVIAPLLFAFAGGPVLAMIYKAVSTMDSMFGYRNERYLHFGWFPARADDFFNFIPARITGLLVCFSALLTGKRFKAALRILLRDHGKSSSPNAGWPEAAAAGALGIKLGGPNRYSGKIVEKPFIGKEGINPKEGDITAVIRLTVVCLVLALVLFTVLRFSVLHLNFLH